MKENLEHGLDQLGTLEMLFFEALECPETEREAYIARACGDDEQLRMSLVGLLRADQGKSGLIDTAPWSADQIRHRVARRDELDPLARPGARIGRYTLLDFVASGGMGTVWRACRADKPSSRIVALKLIRWGMDQKAAMRRFRLEEQVLARLEHPHIARLYDGGTTKHGRPYLVMEFVEGLPITEFARRHELSFKARLKLLQQVCDAVQYAHGSLVLHRDLKPKNILVAADGTPKLLDFGIAKLLETPESVVDGATQTEFRALTPQYASPEQIRGQRLSVATDIYSLGVILYELTVGRLPYRAETGSRHDLERAVLDQEIVKPSAAVLLNKDLSKKQRKTWSRAIRGEIDAICLTALHKDPAKRYRSALEMGEDIRRHLEGIPLLAKPPGPLTRMFRTIRRRRSSIAATLMGLVLGIGLATVYVIRSFLIPEWQEELIRRARLAVIGEQGNSHIYNVLFSTQPVWNPEQITNPGWETGYIGNAAAAYAAAVRLGSMDEKAAIESTIVQLTEDIRSGSKDVSKTLAMLPSHARLTQSYIQGILRNQTPPRFTEQEYNSANTLDLRALGLFSLFIVDMQVFIDTCTRIPMTEPDPMIECLLGYMYLALDEAEHAYPRLVSAYRAYPESGTIALYLADAAVRCGDVAQAEHFLGVADQLGNRDRNFARERIQMLLHLVKGEEEDAINLLCDEFCGRSAVAELQFARYMERTRGVEAAFRALAGRILLRRSGSERAAFEYYVRLMEAWWGQTDETTRKALVNNSGEQAPMTHREFQEFVQRYHTALQVLQTTDSPGRDDIHQLYQRGRWSRLARWTDETMHESSRAELLQIASELPKTKLIYRCAEQCESRCEPLDGGTGFEH